MINCASKWNKHNLDLFILLPPQGCQTDPLANGSYEDLQQLEAKIAKLEEENDHMQKQVLTDDLLVR